MASPLAFHYDIQTDPDTPRDVLVSYLTSEVAEVLHNAAQRGTDPYQGLPHDKCWDGIELSPAHNLDYYRSYAYLFVNAMDKQGLLETFQRSVSSSVAAAIKRAFGPNMCEETLVGLGGAALYSACMQEKTGRTMPTPPKFGGYPVAPERGAEDFWRYRLSILGGVKGIGQAMSLAEDISSPFGLNMYYLWDEVSCGDMVMAELELIGIARSDISVLIDFLQEFTYDNYLIAELRAATVDNEREAHVLVVDGEFKDNQVVPRYYYNFLDPDGYDAYVAWHDAKKMAKGVWKPRKKTKKQYIAACKAREVAVLSQFEMPLTYGVQAEPEYEATVVFDGLSSDGQVRDFLAQAIACYIDRHVQRGISVLDPDVIQGTKWDLDWARIVAEGDLQRSVRSILAADSQVGADFLRALLQVLFKETYEYNTGRSLFRMGLFGLMTSMYS